MTDYLELLLERRREEDEERESLRLGAEEEGAFSLRGRTGRGENPEQPGGTGTNLLETAADTRGRAAEMLPFAGADLPETGEIGAVPRGKTALDALEQALSRAVDALGGAEEDGLRPGLPELSGEDAVYPSDREAGAAQRLSGEGAAFPSGGAAGLARRLSQAALASAAAPARTVFDAGTEEGPPTADWEEFDRRLERDARRYDGGIGIF